MEPTIESRFREYFKMMNKNKINSHCLWDIGIIDALSKYVETEVANVFNISSLALDIGIKIYMLRIDSLHSQLMRLASSLKDSNHIDDLFLDEVIVEKHNKKIHYGRETKEKRLVIAPPESFFTELSKVPSCIFHQKQNVTNSFVDNSCTSMLFLNGWKCTLPFENTIPALAENASYKNEMHYNIVIPHIQNETMVPNYFSTMDNLFPTVEIEETERDFIINRTDKKDNYDITIFEEHAELFYLGQQLQPLLNIKRKWKKKTNFKRKEAVPLIFAFHEFKESMFRKIRNPVMPPYKSEEMITLKEPYNIDLLEVPKSMVYDSETSGNSEESVENSVVYVDQKTNKFIEMHSNAKREHHNVKKMEEMVWNNLLKCTDNFERNTTFSEVYKNISVPEMKKNTKTAMYVVTILHLANDCNLELTTVPNNDIFISMSN